MTRWIGSRSRSANRWFASAAPSSGPLFADDFDRADSTDIGNGWAAYNQGTWGVTSSAAYAANAGGGDSIAVHPVASADYRVDATISDGDGGTLLLARVTDGGNWYGFAINGALVRRLDWGNNVLGVFTGSSSGDRLGISVVGDVVTCYVNDVQVGQVTDAELPSGAPGMRADSGTARFDDFVVVAG